MKPLPKSKDLEVKSVWANGEEIEEPIEKVASPNVQTPYWQITFKDESYLRVTGQVVVKWGPKI